MTWRIAIEHRSGYQYEQPVTSSYNEARITPISSDRQLVLDASVSVSPAATSSRYWDYWGTLVDSFDIHSAHTELVVTGSSVVETWIPEEGPRATLGWEELASHEMRDHRGELLGPTVCVPLDDEIRAVAEPLASMGTPDEACAAAIELVRSRLRYEKGVTNVATTAADALHQGAGVCQDFAHLTLALMRSVGIPARYVSGYLLPGGANGGAIGKKVPGESHAWVEAWTGDWLPLDPTNGDPVGKGHVIVGRARDYADLSPLKGIYHGGSATALGVTVELSRLA